MSTVDHAADGHDTGCWPGVMKVYENDRRVEVWLSGEHDLSTAATVGFALSEAAGEGGVTVVVDMSKVTFSDASILGKLVTGHQQAQSSTGQFWVRSPSKCVRRLLDLCALTTLLEGSGEPGGS